MSLTTQDFTNLRGLIHEVVTDVIETSVNPRLYRIEAHLTNLEEQIRSVEKRITLLNIELSNLRTEVHDIEGRLQAIENDVKALYSMTGRQPRVVFGSKDYRKLSYRAQSMAIYGEMKRLAKLQGLTI